MSEYDDSGSIGRRYARADEIGVPFCVTVDHQTLSDNSVTIRDRDTSEQVRVKFEDVPTKLNSLLCEDIKLEELGDSVKKG